MVQAVADRRLVTILVADVVGYSRLIGLDESGTLRRLKALRREIIEPAVVSAKGRIIKTVGDGFIAEFGSAVRAVSCAVVIQQGVPRHEAGAGEDRALRLRIGINLGEVVVEADGDLYGDGINIAARLEPLAETGGICVAQAVYDQVRDRLGYPFEDRGRLELKNIMRPVGVFALSASAIEGLGSVATAETQEGGSKPSKRPWKAIGAGASIITLLAAGGLLWRSYTAPTTIPAGQTIAAKLTGEAKEAPRLSVVVLPFTNLSSDPEQEFFADGITEDLTTDLSHLAGSFVIARNTAFTYKGKAVDVKQLGRDLGVRYVLEGSVRRIGDKIIINAQLISSETGSHLWADRLEGERSRLGELQAEFVARLARPLDVQLIQEESLRSLRERPNNPDVVDLTLRGWAALNRPRSKVNVAEAINQFEQALRLDPESLQAVVGMSRALAVRARAGWSDNPVSEANKIEEMIAPVLEKRPHNAMAHWSKGQALAFKKQFEQAIYELDAAVDSNANFADGHAFSGLLRIFAGRSSESIPYFEKAIRLSPRDPNLNIWLFDICHAHSHMGNWEQAIDWCHKANAIAPYYMSYIDLATSYGWLGRYDEAKAANEGLLRLMPGYTVKKWATADWSNNPKFVAEYTRMVEGLRRSGLQEE